MRATIAVGFTMTLALAWAGASPGAQHTTAADVEDGGRVFQNVCANCHGPDGNQVAGIDLGRGQLQTQIGGNYQLRKNMTFDFGLTSGFYASSPRIGPHFLHHTLAQVCQRIAVVRR